MIRLHKLPIGTKFLIDGRRRVFTKIGEHGRGSHVYTRNNNVVHKKNSRDPKFIPTCEVRRSNNMKFDMKAWRMVQPVN